MNTLVLPQCTGAGVASAGSPGVAAAWVRAGRVRRMSWSRGCSVASSACVDLSRGWETEVPSVLFDLHSSVASFLCF